MGKRLFIGVDGGQSSTRTLLLDETGRVLSLFRSGPCNHIHEPGGLERQYRELRAGYEGVFRQIGLEPGPVEVVYLGVTGSGHRETIESVYESDRIVITNDAVIAHTGALAGEQGVIVIAGTGSIGFARNATGETAFAGGWGYLIGDEGSAYDIARQGIRAIFRASDYRAPATRLTAPLLDHFESTTLKELHRKLYSGEIGRDRLATGAAVVTRVARDGDETATRILHTAGEELGLLVLGVLRQVLFDGKILVSYIGGVFAAGGIVVQAMMERVQRTYPQATATAPRHPPLIGAALLALRTADVPLTVERIENIQQTFQAVTNNDLLDESDIEDR